MVAAAKLVYEALALCQAREGRAQVAEANAREKASLLDERAQQLTKAEVQQVKDREEISPTPNISEMMKRS